MKQHRDKLRSRHIKLKAKYTNVEDISEIKEVIRKNSKDDQCTLYQPNEPIDSKIISYELYVKFWQFLPGFMRIRSPELIFRATEHGYNIHTFYARCAEYAETYYFCLILIRTIQGGIIGCLIDDMPIETTLNEFQGSLDSFVFSLHPQVKCFKATGNNDFQMLADSSYLAIGMGGEGPALRVDETLNQGRTYRS